MGEGASEARIWAFPVAASVQTCVASLPKKAFRGLRPRAQLTARSGFRVTLGKVTHRLAMCPHLTWVDKPGLGTQGTSPVDSDVLGPLCLGGSSCPAGRPRLGVTRRPQ